MCHDRSSVVAGDRRRPRAAYPMVGDGLEALRSSRLGSALELISRNLTFFARRSKRPVRQRDDEIGEVLELIESLDEFLHASDGAGAEHHTGQLSKLRPNFVFSIWVLEIAACAFSQPCDLTPIGEGEGHPCWLESRHAGVE